MVLSGLPFRHYIHFYICYPSFTILNAKRYYALPVWEIAATIIQKYKAGKYNSLENIEQQPTRTDSTCKVNEFTTEFFTKEENFKARDKLKQYLKKHIEQTKNDLKSAYPFNEDYLNLDLKSSTTTDINLHTMKIESTTNLRLQSYKKLKYLFYSAASSGSITEAFVILSTLIDMVSHMELKKTLLPIFINKLFSKLIEKSSFELCLRTFNTLHSIFIVKWIPETWILLAQCCSEINSPSSLLSIIKNFSILKNMASWSAENKGNFCYFATKCFIKDTSDEEINNVRAKLLGNQPWNFDIWVLLFKEMVENRNYEKAISSFKKNIGEPEDFLLNNEGDLRCSAKKELAYLIIKAYISNKRTEKALLIYTNIFVNNVFKEDLILDEITVKTINLLLNHLVNGPEEALLRVFHFANDNELLIYKKTREELMRYFTKTNNLLLVKELWRRAEYSNVIHIHFEEAKNKEYDHIVSLLYSPNFDLQDGKSVEYAILGLIKAYGSLPRRIKAKCLPELKALFEGPDENYMFSPEVYSKVFGFALACGDKKFSYNVFNIASSHYKDKEELFDILTVMNNLVKDYN
jgi:hypothetical protein